MKNSFPLFIATLISVNTYSNINYIDISKISREGKLITAFNSIKEEVYYYDHWSIEWNFNKPKVEFLKKLRENYSLFSSISIKNEELSLLLGDIAHYLYNMEDTVYYSIAVEHYNAAIKENPTDYRAYWFIGYHYSLSNVPLLAIENFEKAKSLLPDNQPPDFWDEYAFATAVTNMPSHCISAMDKARNISGKEGRFETEQGETIYKKMTEVDKEKTYKKEELWTVSQNDKVTFTSRPLGIQISLDSSWEVSVYDYNNYQSAFIINPPTIRNRKGVEIHYTVALIMKAADSHDKLEDYISTFIKKYSNREKITFSDKYERMISFEIKDNTIYQNIGGGHLYILGIERAEPEYPGLLLEQPSITPPGNPGQVSFYTTPDYKKRFRGKIFYAILLDSCEDINKESFALFQKIFYSQIIIE